MKIQRRYICFAVVLLFTFAAAALQAASIKERMRQRLPVIVSLKAQGIVGENNQGYLEFRGIAKQEEVVAAENKDRRTVYSAIGRQQKTTPENVGKRRAQQIALTAVPGTWIQDPSGKWAKK